MLLALDTSTAFVTVAVYDAEAGVVLSERNAVGPMQHGERLAPTVEAVLGEADLVRQDLTAVVAGVGPGPYTGLRVGVVTARTLALALGIPVYGLCSLDALAAAVVATEPFLATGDARRKELFFAEYDEQGRRVEGPAVARPADIDPAGRLVVGAGPLLFPERFPRQEGPAYPRAADMARLLSEEWAELYDAEPIYLRRPDAVTQADRLGAPKRVS